MTAHLQIALGGEHLSALRAPVLHLHLSVGLQVLLIQVTVLEPPLTHLALEASQLRGPGRRLLTLARRIVLRPEVNTL